MMYGILEDLNLPKTDDCVVQIEQGHTSSSVELDSPNHIGIEVIADLVNALVADEKEKQE